MRLLVLSSFLIFLFSCTKEVPIAPVVSECPPKVYFDLGINNVTENSLLALAHFSGCFDPKDQSSITHQTSFELGPQQILPPVPLGFLGGTDSLYVTLEVNHVSVFRKGWVVEDGSAYIVTIVFAGNDYDYEIEKL